MFQRVSCCQLPVATYAHTHTKPRCWIYTKNHFNEIPFWRINLLHACITSLHLCSCSCSCSLHIAPWVSNNNNCAMLVLLVSTELFVCTKSMKYGLAPRHLLHRISWYKYEMSAFWGTNQPWATRIKKHSSDEFHMGFQFWHLVRPISIHTQT